MYDAQVVEYTHVLTGYVKNVEFLRELAKIIKDIKERNPNLIYGKKLFLPKKYIIMEVNTIEKNQVT